MEFPNSLHNALRSVFQVSGGTDRWTRQNTKNLCKELTPQQQNLLRDVAENAATNRERACELGVAIRTLESISTSESKDTLTKHGQIQALTEQIQLLASRSGVTRHPMVKAASQEVAKSAPVDLVTIAMIEFMLIRDFVQFVRQDSSLLQRLQIELKPGQAIDASDRSGIKKTIAATVENWVIAQKRPTDVTPLGWKKLVRDSIADPHNSKLSLYKLPNLHHFIQKQVMTVRQALISHS